MAKHGREHNKDSICVRMLDVRCWFELSTFGEKSCGAPDMVTIQAFGLSASDKETLVLTVGICWCNVDGQCYINKSLILSMCMTTY